MWSPHVITRRGSRTVRTPPLNPRLIHLALALSRQSIHPAPARRV